MSEYPPNPSYGLRYGAQDQPNPPYLPPVYPAQYMQPDDSRMAHANLASNYDASIAAYGYNAAATFNPTPMGSAVPPVPQYTGWNQDPAPLAQYNPHSGPQYTGYPDNAHHNSPYYPPPQAAYQPPTHPTRPYDEGEVSEGEFERHAVHMNNGPATYLADQLHVSGSPAYVDPSQRPSYAQPQAQSSQQPYGAANYKPPPRDSPRGRRPSDAYSPHVSPAAVDYNEPGNTNQSYNLHTHRAAVVATNDSVQGHSNQIHIERLSDAQSRSITRDEPISTEPSTGHVSQTDTQPEIGQGPNATSTALADARKKAQAAILNLWPYDVRFQTYLEEGFEEELVGSLFDDLKMPRVSARPGVNAQRAKEGIPLVKNTRQVNPRRSISPPVTTSAANAVTVSQNPDEKHHGANGRPLPLSTQSNSKQVATNGPTSTKNSTAMPVNAASTVVKTTAAMTEKERTLQSKMDALRKSREERAQKAAAKNVKSPTNAPSNLQPQSQLQSATSPLSTIQTQPPTSSDSIAAPNPAPPTDILTTNSTISSEAPKLQHQSQTAAIPGLFLASTGPTPGALSNVPSTIATTTQINQRKRPVAADFDPPATTITPFKRPFGHSRHDHRLVIDVSDEEADSDDEDVEMDLESQADQDSPMQPARKMSDQRTAAIHNLPPLSDYPSRKPFTPPPNSSAIGTPPISKVALGRPEVLQRKESQIEQLKKRIAEAEARKKARQTPSGAQSPHAGGNQNVEATDGTSSNASITSKVEASMKMQQLIGIADTKVSSNQQKLLATQVAELEKTAELKKNEDEIKRLRLQKIASDLPLIDEQVQQTQTKLEQLRSEAAKLEADILKNIEIKRQMAEEMERLGQETEQRLQAEKEKLQGLTEAETGNSSSNDESCRPSLSADEEEGIVRSPLLVASHDQPSRSDYTSSEPLRIAEVRDADPVATQRPDHDISNQQDPTLSVEDGNIKLTGVSPTTQQMTLVPLEQPSVDKALEAALQEAVRAEADSHALSDVELEASFAPDPNQLAPESPSSLADVELAASLAPNPNQLAPESLVDEESRSPGYSPVLERSAPDIPNAGGESDNYEPPEATPPVDTVARVYSPPFSPAPPDTVIEPSSVDESMQITNDTRHEPASEMPLRQNGSVPQVGQNVVAKSNPDEPQLFTPYESPLKNFSAFRFHPNYKEEVAGGLRSLTYSHKIDPTVEFCRYELAGGICNDSTCEYQHFKDIGLPDDVVLTNLGSPEQFNASQRDKFCEGLRAVLTGLRARKIKDFDVIASEIATHRSKFLGDSTNVLNLEGTGI